MGIIEGAIKKIYAISTGNPLKKVILTPIVGGSFAVATALFIIIPIQIEKVYNIPAFWNAPVNYIIGLPLIILGALLMLWTSLIFFFKHGTPVPVNPPPKLITTGPYTFSRNPMHGGMILLMFGFGFYYCSLLAVFIFIPLYILIDTWILRNIEEPELAKRLGDEYVKYKERTPMFLGWKKRKT
jgi:protein-S-isoprenylcysteine O-methyltransferase Ste14